mmetsp:Transcript_18730/g.47410  ORF Transcript_18730/g.47410 Transcript_18730/m.47410 type:complete len:207 (-) Transcript_18730:185-805(-)
MRASSFESKSKVDETTSPCIALHAAASAMASSSLDSPLFASADEMELRLADSISSSSVRSSRMRSKRFILPSYIIVCMARPRMSCWSTVSAAASSSASVGAGARGVGGREIFSARRRHCALDSSSARSFSSPPAGEDGSLLRSRSSAPPAEAPGLRERKTWSIHSRCLTMLCCLRSRDLLVRELGRCLRGSVSLIGRSSSSCSTPP